MGLCHLGNGNLRGAIKLYRTSRDYMEGLPSPFLGMDLVPFWEKMDACFAPLLTNPDQPGQDFWPGDRLPVIDLAPAPDAWPALEPEEPG